MFINLNKFKTSSVYKAISSLFLDFTATNTLDDRVTFSRTSNATVTNSAGLIAYAPHNLLTFSEQFDSTGWGKSAGVTVLANSSVAPNGTTTADTVTFTGTSLAIAITASSTITGLLVTSSIYIQGTAGETIQTATGGVDQQFTLDGTWQRLSATKTAINNTFNINTFGGSTARTIKVWGAQLEIGSTATTYNSTTVKNLLGFTEAFDNAAWTKSNSFVQTNLLLQSEDFGTTWVNTESSETLNVAVAPNGTLTADKLVENSATNFHAIEQTVASVSATSYTFSVYAKYSERNIQLFFGFNDVTGNPHANFNLQNGTVGTTAGTITASIQDVGNGWYRCNAIITSAVTTDFQCFVNLITSTSAGRAASYAGDGTSGAFLWGAQLVQGAVAGDYRRTSAAALPVFYPNQNGVVCAEKLVATGGSFSRIFQSSSVAGVVGGIINFSVYLKADTTTNASLRIIDGGGTETLQNITLTNQWQRYSVSRTLAGTSPQVHIFNNLNGVSGTASAGDAIYIFGAQLSDSASLDPYVLNAAAAPTAAAYYGPRFDYDPVTLQPKGLLIEEQRTNLATYSEDFSNAAWIKQRLTVSQISEISPNGNLTSSKLIEDTSASITHQLASVQAFVSGAVTISFYAKAAGRNWVLFNTNATGTYQSSYFNVSTGVIGTAGTGHTLSIAQAGNGWYRCFIALTSASATNRDFTIGLASADNVNTYTGNGVSGIYLFGAQVEAGAFATSYIPTVASQVTRTADNASIVGSNFYSWYNQNEGSLYSETIALSNTAGVAANGIAISTTDASTNSSMILLGDPRTTQNTALYVFNGGVSTGSVQVNNTVLGQLIKAAGGYQVNNVALASNGTLSSVDTSTAIPIGTGLYLGYYSQNTTLFKNGYIKKFSYYNTRLSNSTLQSITS
jgi:hypothetical protein